MRSYAKRMFVIDGGGDGFVLFREVRSGESRKMGALIVAVPRVEGYLDKGDQRQGEFARPCLMDGDDGRRCREEEMSRGRSVEMEVFSLLGMAEKETETEKSWLYGGGATCRGA